MSRSARLSATSGSVDRKVPIPVARFRQDAPVPDEPLTPSPRVVIAPDGDRLQLWVRRTVPVGRLSLRHWRSAVWGGWKVIVQSPGAGPLPFPRNVYVQGCPSRQAAQTLAAQVAVDIEHGLAASAWRT